MGYPRTFGSWRVLSEGLGFCPGELGNPWLFYTGVTMAKESRTVALFRYFHLLDKPGILVYELLYSLLQMTDEQPQLLMEVSPNYNRTFLHVAVMANSEVQVEKMLDMILADMDIAASITRNVRLFLSLKYLSTVESLSSCTAFQMACRVGHKGIVDMIARDVKRK